jgi:hypothetical protein
MPVGSAPERQAVWAALVSALPPVLCILSGFWFMIANDGAEYTLLSPFYDLPKFANDRDLSRLIALDAPELFGPFRNTWSCCALIVLLAMIANIVFAIRYPKWRPAGTQSVTLGTVLVIGALCLPGLYVIIFNAFDFSASNKPHPAVRMSVWVPSFMFAYQSVLHRAFTLVLCEWLFPTAPR